MPDHLHPRAGRGGPPDPAAVEIGPLALVRFTAELGMLAALGYAGWHLTDVTALSVVLAVVLPLAAAVLLTVVGPNPLAAVLAGFLAMLFVVSLPHRRAGRAD